jgi:transcriptional regulator GlxA family with amidase domain
MNSKLSRAHNWPEVARKANWSASVLAIQFGVSLRTMHRYFVKKTGKNTKTWLAEQRQQDANELLRAGSSVKKTAIVLGYNQPNNFSRNYKKYWGVCPSQQFSSDNLACNKNVPK